MVCWIVLQVILFEFVEFIHPLEVHEHLLHKAVIDQIVLRKMMATVFGGKQIEVSVFLTVNLNHSNIIHQGQIPISETLVDIQINYVLGNCKW